MTETVAIHDVPDVRAMARAAVGEIHHRKGLVFTPDEWEEMTSEAMLVIFEMARSFDGRCGERSSFAGFAWTYLPRKLLDRYPRVRAQGHWCESLDEIGSQAGGPLAPDIRPRDTFPDSLRHGLLERAVRVSDLDARVGGLAGAGLGWSEIKAKLEISEEQLRDCIKRIAAVAWTMERP